MIMKLFYLALLITSIVASNCSLQKAYKVLDQAVEDKIFPGASFAILLPGGRVRNKKRSRF